MTNGLSEIIRKPSTVVRAAALLTTLLGAAAGCGEPVTSRGARADGGDVDGPAVVDAAPSDGSDTAVPLDEGIDDASPAIDSVAAIDTGAADVGTSTDLPSGGSPGTVIADSVKGRVWPASHGEALISLWQDDKLGAISLTIDVASKADHSWWIAQGNTFGLRFTWFIVSDQPGTGSPYATWADFAALLAMGHDVQSHTVTHLDGSLTIDQEYKDSAAAIEANLPGHPVRMLAYPGGNNSSMNSVAVAKLYYLGARGTAGKHNVADQINYINTNSISAVWTYAPDHWASLTNIVTYNPSRSTSYRAWQCMHFHNMAPANRTEAVTGFQWLEAHAADMWPALFREVILYGQERDTATLKVPHVSADTIALELTDTLDDDLFAYPLTLKVGLASHWTAASATQAGAATPVKIISHNGKPYALVRAVPDGGQVVLSRE